MNQVGKKVICPGCRQETVLKVTKKYDGFTPVGEARTCPFCGYEFGEAEPEKVKERVPGWIHDRGLKRVCHRCRHYVVNPFVQKCGLTGEEVDALDNCSQFSPHPDPSPEDAPDEGTGGKTGPSIFGKD